MLVRVTAASVTTMKPASDARSGGGGKIPAPRPRDRNAASVGAHAACMTHSSGSAERSAGAGCMGQDRPGSASGQSHSTKPAAPKKPPALSAAGATANAETWQSSQTATMDDRCLRSFFMTLVASLTEPDTWACDMMSHPDGVITCDKCDG